MRSNRAWAGPEGGGINFLRKEEPATGETGAVRQGSNQLINNRQGGRRRGRGGPRPQGMSGNAGNRQDNRQRGNAAQLLEKYKTLARDAQLAGDRVQTEYYLQYADHYFRVLEESRSRFEDQQSQSQSQRRRRGDDEDDIETDEELMAEGDSGEDEGEVDTRQRPRRERGRDRFERPERAERAERPVRRDFQANGASRDGDADNEAESDERISLGVLPPAIGASETEEPQEAPKPRRRARKPRAEDGDEEIAPVA